MGKDNRRNITVTNSKVDTMLNASSNASLLIEEAMLYLDYQISNHLISDREKQRLIDKGLIRFELYN